jgi:hypothetical protein
MTKDSLVVASMLRCNVNSVTYWYTNIDGRVTTPMTGGFPVTIMVDEAPSSQLNVQYAPKPSKEVGVH